MENLKAIILNENEIPSNGDVGVAMIKLFKIFAGNATLRFLEGE